MSVISRTIHCIMGDRLTQLVAVTKNTFLPVISLNTS